MIYHALGEYPDSPDFDPNRSSWLPYWVNTETEVRNRCIRLQSYDDPSCPAFLTNAELSISPVARPPLAPQTADAMRSWTPEDYQEALAQQMQQFAAGNLARQQSQGSGAPPAPTMFSDSTWLLIVAALGALLFLRG